MPWGRDEQRSGIADAAGRAAFFAARAAARVCRDHQTPGMRLLRVRVQTAAGDVPSDGRSIVRLVGLVLAIVPMFLGFVPVLFDERRRGIAEFMAGTVVLYDDAFPSLD